ncbi:hypothetical protein NDU88_002078 [Pleurodeles waltl]|uniref:Uncharacterized protein n=1 Tax=Pleurodeles waltl TaxID=8319 RepID=A0AAV7VBZ9_PLEWA|nr:hypothetical protein NDU88_002078 [Pleurodeles waltl]
MVVLAERKHFLLNKRTLQHTDANYFLLYPTKLRILHQGKTHYFTDPKTTAKFTKTILTKAESLKPAASGAGSENLSDND